MYRCPLWHHREMSSRDCFVFEKKKRAVFSSHRWVQAADIVLHQITFTQQSELHYTTLVTLQLLVTYVLLDVDVSHAFSVELLLHAGDGSVVSRDPVDPRVLQSTFLHHIAAHLHDERHKLHRAQKEGDITNISNKNKYTRLCIVDLWSLWSIHEELAANMQTTTTTTQGFRALDWPC